MSAGRHCSADWEKTVEAEHSDAHNAKDKRLFFDLANIANLRMESGVVGVYLQAAIPRPMNHSYQTLRPIRAYRCERADCICLINSLAIFGAAPLPSRAVTLPLATSLLLRRCVTE